MQRGQTTCKVCKSKALSMHEFYMSEDSIDVWHFMKKAQQPFQKNYSSPTTSAAIVVLIALIAVGAHTYVNNPDSLSSAKVLLSFKGPSHQ